MFWSLHGGATSALDTLLAGESGFTLEQLLEEEDLLQECKSQNTKLLDFLVDPENMMKLIGFVIDMPSESDSEMRRFKFPYVASEVLCCDFQSIRDVMFTPGRQLVHRLFSILQQEPPLAPVSIGYMSKVVVALFKGEDKEFCAFFNVMWTHADGGAPMALPTLLKRLMLHLGSDAVLQMLTVLCVGEPSVCEPVMAQIVQPPAESWLPHRMLVPALFEVLASADPEAAQNASVLLTMVLEASPELPPFFCEPEAEARLRCAALVKMCFAPGSGAGLTVTSAGPATLNPPALDVLVRLLARCRETGSPSACAPSLLQVWTALLAVNGLRVAIPPDVAGTDDLRRTRAVGTADVITSSLCHRHTRLICCRWGALLHTRTVGTANLVPSFFSRH